jgi:hypothetical protein
MTQRSLPNTVSTAWTYNSMGFLNVRNDEASVTAG